MGVASPRAQGQEMISTEIEARIALRVSPTIKYQAKKVTKEMMITVGTKILATLSANLAIGIFLLPASLSKAMIFARVVSLERFKTWTFKVPVLLIVPAFTSSPTLLYTGIGSPVIMEVSTSASPSTIRASQEIFSPCFISTISPTFNSLARIVFISPLLSIKFALSGAKFIRFFRKSVALFLLLSSKRRPSKIKVMMTLAPSK